MDHLEGRRERNCGLGSNAGNNQKTEEKKYFQL